MTNYYRILELTEDASAEEIKSTFKRLAVKYHPDKHPGKPEMEEKFKEINQAYQVLSDPYEKARFDLKLKYQQFSTTHTQQQTTYNDGKRSYQHPRRPFYRQQRLDARQNAIATAYAFGITFFIAALVMGGIWVKQSINDQKQREYLAERRSAFETAKNDFESGNYSAAYKVMTEFTFFMKEERDMEEFKNNMVDQIIDRGHRELANKNFNAAINLYNQAFKLKPQLPFLNVKKRLVEAYKQAGEIDKAISMLEDFLVNDFDIIASLVHLAEIHRDYLDDAGEAMENFQLAHRLAAKRYKKIYGEGYPILIRQEHLPRSHYYLYSGLANMYLKTGNEKMAIKAADWNKYVWPDSVDAYITTGHALIAAGNPELACVEFEEAANRGWAETIPINCESIAELM
ncbi:MAG: DnaJ domain-containing protein [Ekhidna sp.]|nr:DnaJ domain-containing protein [Ekhidna sp.]